MTTSGVSRYIVPRQWLRYDHTAVTGPLIEAKTAAGVLNRMPYLAPDGSSRPTRSSCGWRLSAPRASRAPSSPNASRTRPSLPTFPSGAGLTHSQRQLRAANTAYHWIRSLPANRPVTAELVLGIHRSIVTGCDDDHCEPGATRSTGSNVTFGIPRCRGVEGGDDCRATFGALAEAIAGEFRGHDRIIQAMAAHYHIDAMHPFDDGNGRTARALEAFMLREANVNDMVMVSLSNYYYEHKDEYLAALYESRESGHDLTPFLTFALPAVAERCNAIADDIVKQNKRTLYREFARSLFGRLRSPRRRVLAERQLQVLHVLLDGGPVSLGVLRRQIVGHYQTLRFPDRAMVRDLVGLLDVSAVALNGDQIAVNLDWPQKFSESELLERYEQMPSAVSANHPAMAELSRLLGRRR